MAAAQRTPVATMSNIRGRAQSLVVPNRSAEAPRVVIATEWLWCSASSEPFDSLAAGGADSSSTIR